MVCSEADDTTTHLVQLCNFWMCQNNTALFGSSMGNRHDVQNAKSLKSQTERPWLLGLDRTVVFVPFFGTVESNAWCFGLRFAVVAKPTKSTEQHPAVILIRMISFLLGTSLLILLAENNPATCCSLLFRSIFSDFATACDSRHFAPWQQVNYGRLSELLKVRNARLLQWYTLFIVAFM